MDMTAVNSLSYEDFVEVFGNVVEKCPIVAAAAWSRKPFATLADLEAAVGEFIDCLPVSGKQGILRCHPDLAGRDLQSGSLTPESQNEQRQAGLTALDPAETTLLGQLNFQYKERFGFPFVICARMNNKATILHRLTERLGNETALELDLAIDEVKKICHLRLLNIRLPASHSNL